MFVLTELRVLFDLVSLIDEKLIDDYCVREYIQELLSFLLLQVLFDLY